ncbi:hypothetical protein Pla52n_15590 [Stieleria varia]|uniref:Uncharacterized protein n=1 Tax=Stieleria varia TaxID=2528005 RepID=A0A5C6B5R5_9BACT|nr:hypothetical protein Pla52n_15590 [Stieleria varia]
MQWQDLRAGVRVGTVGFMIALSLRESRIGQRSGMRSCDGMAIWKRLKVAESLLEFRRRKRWEECPRLAEVCETLAI